MNIKRPFSEEEFREIYSKVPRLCVELVVKTPDGIVLTLRNLPTYKGKWHTPGGTVYYGENVTDTVRRIASEELGISVKVADFLGYIDYGSEEKERGFGWTVGLAFLCYPESGDMKSDGETLEIKSFKKLPDNMIEQQRVFLESVWNKIS